MNDLKEWLSLSKPGKPFSDELVGAGADLARRLSRRTRGEPDLQALAFWMRRSQLERLQEAFSAMQTAEIRHVARGTVFHLCPSNVDTVFVYSWLLSALGGNSNVIRLSERRGPASERLLGLLNEVLAESPLGLSTLVITYPHDQAVTTAISGHTDMRVVWGGDRAVAEVRLSPLPPMSTELVFADRVSLAAVSAAGYLRRDEAARVGLAEQFFNDAYWFDQMACSSPRTVVWIGSRSDSMEASASFFGALARVVSVRGYHIDAGTSMSRLAYQARAALDHPVTGITAYGPSLSVISADALVETRNEDWCGAGTFWELTVPKLDDLAQLLSRRHQTLAYADLAENQQPETLSALVEGRGVDRIVPIGQALTFSRYWDGHDLLRAFLRIVNVLPPVSPDESRPEP